MREIKFRGYDSVGSKGWVYGDLVHNQKVTREGLEPRVMVGGYEVDPESLGQCIGITDCTGRELYEGDILEMSTTFDGMLDKTGFVSYIDESFVYEMEKSHDGRRRYTHLFGADFKWIGTKYEQRHEAGL